MATAFSRVLLPTRHYNIAILNLMGLFLLASIERRQQVLGSENLRNLGMQISLQSVWRIARFVLIIQVFNAVMDYFMWMVYDDSVSILTVAALTVSYTILFLAIKVAVEREASIPR